MGSTSMTIKSKRVMERVWEKRQKKLQKATNLILSQFESKSMNFDSVEVYIRKAGSFADSDDNAQKEVHIALRGIAHTVVEGIRLSELTLNAHTQCIEASNRFKPDEMYKISAYNDMELSSLDIVKWINTESQTKYNMITNSCVHFSFYFYFHFLSGIKTKQFVQSLLA